MEIETQHSLYSKKESDWGYKQPTILIESQSAPVLLEDPVEQSYMRAFVLTDKSDLVVTDFKLNQTYIKEYLKNSLGLDPPEYLVVPNLGGSCLTDNILGNPKALESIKNWASLKNPSTQLQFFNVTDKEKDLAEKLEIPSTSGSLENTIQIGSKPGFRRFCEETDLPMPHGFICNDVKTTTEALDEIFVTSDLALIKAENGTGGNDLVSNIHISKDSLSGLSIKDKEAIVKTKLEFFGEVLGKEWVVEEYIAGEEGSIHVYIHDEAVSEEPFTIGAISENNSYVGGFGPVEINEEKRELIHMVKHIAVPELQKIGVYGYHCFDYKDGMFLEDNARQGALDFINGMVGRVASIHYPNQKYHYWHYHMPLGKTTTFDDLWKKFEPLLDPNSEKNKKNKTLLVVTNPEVLPYGRSLDATSVTFGPDSSIDKAKQYYNDAVGEILNSI